MFYRVFTAVKNFPNTENCIEQTWDFRYWVRTECGSAPVRIFNSNVFSMVNSKILPVVFSPLWCNAMLTFFRSSIGMAWLKLDLRVNATEPCLTRMRIWNQTVHIMRVSYTIMTPVTFNKLLLLLLFYFSHKNDKIIWFGRQGMQKICFYHQFPKIKDCFRIIWM